MESKAILMSLLVKSAAAAQVSPMPVAARPSLAQAKSLVYPGAGAKGATSVRKLIMDTEHAKPLKFVGGLTTPYGDPAGRASVGWGQDYVDGKRVSFGEKFTRRQISDSFNKSIGKIEDGYRETEADWDKLPSRIRAIATAQKYNTGQNYPKFLEAFRSGDMEGAFKESRSFWRPNGEGTPKAPLTRRNDFMRTLLNEQFESMRAGKPLALNRPKTAVNYA